MLHSNFGYIQHNLHLWKYFYSEIILIVRKVVVEILEIQSVFRAIMIQMIKHFQ